MSRGHKKTQYKTLYSIASWNGLCDRNEIVLYTRTLKWLNYDYSNRTKIDAEVENRILVYNSS